MMSLINDYILRHHSKNSIGRCLFSEHFHVTSPTGLHAADLYCAGGYILARTLARLIVEQPPDILPEVLYKGLCVSAEYLSMIKTDDYWENSLQMHFQSPIFLTASASLSSAVQASGMHTFTFFRKFCCHHTIPMVQE